MAAIKQIKQIARNYYEPLVDDWDEAPNDLDVSDQSKTEPEDRYYIYHAYFTLLFWGFSAIYLLTFIINRLITIPSGIVATIQLIAPVIFFGVGVTVLILAFASLIGFYLDAKYLTDTDSDYIPVWWLWILSSFVLTLPIMAPAYLLIRNWKVGNDYEGTALSVVPFM